MKKRRVSKPGLDPARPCGAPTPTRFEQGEGTSNRQQHSEPCRRPEAASRSDQQCRSDPATQDPTSVVNVRRKEPLRCIALLLGGRSFRLNRGPAFRESIVCMSIQ
jgi:hypothetical protein